MMFFRQNFYSKVELKEYLNFHYKDYEFHHQYENLLLLMIYHNENSSTNEAFKNKYKKRKLIIENELKSKKILLSRVLRNGLQPALRRNGLAR